MVFTDDEMKTLWRHVGECECIDMVLIQCYSGWRPGELVDLKLENINLSDGVMKGGSKTDAGIDRVIPIHPRIRQLMIKYSYLANHDRRQNLFTITKYKSYHTEFQNLMKTLGMDTTHRPHDCRKHFVSMAKRYGVDEYAIKKIVGHAISDITEKIYTQRDPNWLRTEIEKIV